MSPPCEPKLKVSPAPGNENDNSTYCSGLCRVLLTAIPEFNSVVAKLPAIACISSLANLDDVVVGRVAPLGVTPVRSRNSCCDGLV